MDEIIEIYSRIKAIADENPLFAFPAIMTVLDEMRETLSMSAKEIYEMMLKADEATKELERR